MMEQVSTLALDCTSVTHDELDELPCSSDTFIRIPLTYVENVLANKNTWEKKRNLLKGLSMRKNTFRYPNNRFSDIQQLFKQFAIVRDDSEKDHSQQSWQFSIQHFRVLHALFTVYFDNGYGSSQSGEYYFRSVNIAWPELYRAAGIPPNSSNRQFKFREALRELAFEQHKIPVFCVVRESGPNQFPQTWFVDARKEPIIKMRHITNNAASGRDTIEIMLSPCFRRGLNYWWLEIPRNLFPMLEGAITEQYQNRGVQTRDYKLLLYMYFQKHKANSNELDIYIDHSKVFQAIPELRRYVERREVTRARDYIEQTIDIFHRAGIILNYKLNVNRSVKARRAQVDCLEINPDMFPHFIEKGGEE